MKNPETAAPATVGKFAGVPKLPLPLLRKTDTDPSTKPSTRSGLPSLFMSATAMAMASLGMTTGVCSVPSPLPKKMSVAWA